MRQHAGSRAPKNAACCTHFLDVPTDVKMSRICRKRAVFLLFLTPQFGNTNWAQEYIFSTVAGPGKSGLHAFTGDGARPRTLNGTTRGTFYPTQGETFSSRTPTTTVSAKCLPTESLRRWRAAAPMAWAMGGRPPAHSSTIHPGSGAAAEDSYTRPDPRQVHS